MPRSVIWHRFAAVLIFTHVSHFSEPWSDNSRLGKCSPRSEFMGIDEIIALPRAVSREERMEVVSLSRLWKVEEDFFDRWTKFVTNICHSLFIVYFIFAIQSCRRIDTMVKYRWKWKDERLIWLLTSWKLKRNKYLGIRDISFVCSIRFGLIFLFNFILCRRLWKEIWCFFSLLQIHTNIKVVYLCDLKRLQSCDNYN